MALQRSALWAVALAAVALALPTAATADHGVPFLHDELTSYFGVAQAYWGEPVPACLANGTTSIPVHAVLYDDPNPDVAARAEQPGCRMWLDRSSWRAMGPVEACTIVVHEWGHMVGRAHVDDPFDLMAEFPARAPRACAALRPTRAARASARSVRGCSAGARRVRRGHRKPARVVRRSCVMRRAAR
jgi:hypothetical protein